MKMSILSKIRGMSAYAKVMLFLAFAANSSNVWPQTATQDGNTYRKGKELLENNCSRCHAISTDDISNHSEAPAFRNISERYPVDYLEEALAEGIFTGHSDMPVFEFEGDEVDEIISYLNSLQAR